MFFLQVNEPNQGFHFIATYWWVIVLIIIIFSGLFSINQGYVGVITMFGKYRRAARPGLNFKLPFLEQVMKKIYNDIGLDYHTYVTTINHTGVKTA